MPSLTAMPVRPLSPGFDADHDEALYEDAPCGYLSIRSDGLIVRVNRTFLSWMGYRADELLGVRRLHELMSAAGRILHETHYLPLLALQGRVSDMAVELLQRDRNRLPVLVSAVRHEGMDGQQRLTRVTVLNATERRHHEQALRLYREKAECAHAELDRHHALLSQTHEQLQATLAAIGDAVVAVDPQQRITLVNRRAEALFGWTAAEVMGQPLASACELHDRLRQSVLPGLLEQALVSGRIEHLEGDARLAPRHRPGLPDEVCQVDVTAARIIGRDGHADGVVLGFRDVTQQVQLTRALVYQVSHDSLTGLCSRSEFEARLRLLLAQPAGADSSHVLCLMDLDQFKLVNDTCGHPVGDELLRQISRLLSGCVREGDLLARVGGDEFAVLLQNCPLALSQQIAQRMREQVQRHRITHKGRLFGVGLSIGLVPLGPQYTSLEAAMSDADLACYAAKEAGRNRVHALTAEDTVVPERRRQMNQLSELRAALVEDRLTLYFQPIVPVRPQPGQHLTGEVLLRLRLADGSLLGPGAFIPAAELYGQMEEIDRWVLRQSLAQMVRHPGLALSVNVSGQSLGSPEFLAFALAALDNCVADAPAGAVLQPACLCLEITESAAISQLKQAQQFIHSLKARGVRFALDDFGTGLSSLSYLRQLPVDEIKLDGSFVRGLDTDPVDAVSVAIVESVVRVARTMGLQTVAEGVEWMRLVPLLTELGVDHLQGYALGRPQPLVEMLAQR